MDKIKVIVVDDSALMRKIISDIINSDNSMEVIATCRNGEDLLIKLQKQKPDVITLDVEMPKMDGITTLKNLKLNKYNIPIIVLSSISKRGTDLTFECLENGAFDFIPKPSGAISLDINKIEEALKNKIKLAYNKNYDLDKKYDLDRKIETEEQKKEFVKIKEDIKKEDIKKEVIFTSNIRNKKINAVVIGASTGGPKALYKVVTKLPQNIGVPVFIVQHMPVGFTKAFADRLNANSEIEVVEATDGENIKDNVVYVARGGIHMEVGGDKKIHFNTEPPIWGVRPAVDKLFISASKIYKENLLSVVLTGMGKDGAEGTIVVKENGGITISEDKSTCTIYGMPKAAYETGKVDKVFPIDDIAGAIIKIIKG
ncbi:chemotaxis response regulator protein-glutamate methylesterase [Clostridium sp. MB40-C1]|uniref:protein-glutamate methylesterase/protein-glutamine glutaminase n=1 Tax=Clostridium sp. MB40-C1 TaxID=3070996 RepID=UPI0027E0568F|nr:chemotaxis response regulator protein-glutamate methylesterase [Clostridium sp. MB40-C1]WMJ81291.1 chemotaxis response regulator protein-glutamate methylesterase [Clostridium sp. MB40-C1]